MPIANCILSPLCPSRPAAGEPERVDDLIHLWATHADRAHALSEMTVNVYHAHAQLGKQYRIMAHLLLPSIWSKEDVSALQLGLARALADYYAIAVDEVMVTTNILHSGLVVENGEEIRW